MPDIKPRRQNHSCEQCRHAKKACDGYWLNQESVSRSDGLLVPCSYCAKTKKRCGLNSSWKNAKPATPFINDEADHGLTQPLDFFDLFGDDSSPASNDELSSWGAASSPSTLLSMIDSQTPNLLPDAWTAAGCEPYLGSFTPATGVTDPASSFNYPFSSDFAPSTFSASLTEDTTFSGHGILPTSIEHDAPTLKPEPSQGTVFKADRLTRKELKNRRMQSKRSARQDSQGKSRLVDCPDSDLAARSNRYLVTENLLKVYHDVLENNLTCWLSEATCPYKSQLLQPSSSPHQQGHLRLGDPDQQKYELGEVWSNRMYRRVRQLDRAAEASLLIRLTKPESQAASKALNLVIMAFAAQWTQGTRRRRNFPSAASGQRQHAELQATVGELASDFEQDFQKQILVNAERALAKVAHLECFTVAYAELIFGYIHGHDAVGRQDRTFGSESRGLSAQDGVGCLTSSLISEILSQEPPPIYSERAARKIHVLKCRSELSPLKTSNGSRQPRGTTLNNEELDTIALLYWFAVMTDTLESTLKERPVALPDERDMPKSAPYDLDLSSPRSEQPRTSASGRWDLRRYSFDDPDQPSIVRWPCDYEVAAQAVARSAAVKVLLFRHVLYLQQKLRDRDFGQPIEDTIQSAKAVYRYWNLTHGALFRDLIKSYDSVPCRIKAWFPCIQIPWHLAVFLLADLIDTVDQNGLGVEAASMARIAARTTAKIKSSSAIELAELAMVASPQDLDSQPMTEQLPNYHFAVNEGSLLTEPWSMLLIRAFALAAVFHLNAAEDLKQSGWLSPGSGLDEYEVALERCSACSKALWFLARKSDVATEMTLVLVDAMHQLQVANGSSSPVAV